MGEQREERSERRRRPRKTQSTRRWRWGVKILLTLCLVGVLTLAMFSAIFLRYVNTTLAPDLTVNVDEYTMNLTTKVYCEDRSTGEWVEYEEIHGVENRTLVEYDEIPQYVIDAVISIEDERFRSHHGVDWKRTAGAVVNMFFGMKNTFGGSTITQQLIKNVTKDDEGTVKRKVTEIFRALEFEKNYSKEEILHLYLNTVYFGKDAYGIAAAAETYFNKEVSELTLAESACIVGITNNPYQYNPLRNDWTREQNKKRQTTILNKMLELGKITQAEYDQAIAEELHFSDGTTSQEKPLETTEQTQEYYSYFTDYVIKQVLSDLQTKNGLTAEAASKKLFNGGYSIYVTVDPRIQSIAEEVYENREQNLNYTSAKGQSLQSGITILDPYTGYVVAMVGGIGEKQGDRIGSYATAVRPCGSAIKPLSVYAPALDSGAITLATTMDDYPVQILNGEAWPKNSNRRYKGLTTVESAVKNSTNTVAVRVLQKIGPTASYEFMTENLGFTTLVPDDMQASSLALGGLTKGVSTLEVAAAYSAFVNEGIYTTPRAYTKVLDHDGNVVLENQAQSHTAMKESTAYQMNELLKAVITSGTGSSAAFSGMTIAGKTGTTSNNYDRYFVGYTPYYCAAVWIGYEYMERISVSGNPAAVLWKKVMSAVHEDLPNKDFFTPSYSALETVTVCQDSGLLAGDSCLHTHEVKVAKGQAPAEECQAHSVVSICTDSGCLAGAYCPNTEVRSVVSFPRTVLSESSDPKVYDDNGKEILSVVTSEDSEYLLQYWEAKGECTEHVGSPVHEGEEYVSPSEGEDPTEEEPPAPEEPPTDEEGEVEDEVA